MRITGRGEDEGGGVRMSGRVRMSKRGEDEWEG